METLYLCGAGNPEGVRLALTLNTVHKRWARIVLLDDDPSRHGQQILGVEIAGDSSDTVSEPSTEILIQLVRLTH